MTGTSNDLPAQTVSLDRTQKLVIAGDFPDPSIIRVGDTYYASCSSSEWGPVFSIAKSTNLIDWSIVDYAMPVRPAWSTSNYWAPELYHDGKQFFIYYTGRKAGGPLCVSVATADQIEGPWTDHGPLVCEAAGSIDASCVKDDKGQKFLIWKEDGNSINKPTPIWAQKLEPNGIALTGEQFELFRNDTPWEKNLVEGAFIMKKGDYFYCFYAGAGCCGINCDYAVGVARSKSIEGKWEKYNKNPILAGNAEWKCPGHGTVVTDKQGNDIFMYHAYSTESSVYVGRQTLISQLNWNKEGWPEIQHNATILNGPSNSVFNFRDDFTVINNQWRWPVEYKPSFTTKKGMLALTAMPAGTENKVGAVLAQSTLSSDYEASTAVKIRRGVYSGLSAFGDEKNAVGLSVDEGNLVLWKVERSTKKLIKQAKAPAVSKLYLKLIVNQGKLLSFAYSINEKDWIPFGETDGAFLPPWDRGVRVALLAEGTGIAYFDWFNLIKI
jgi:xylan 1,4-beta-xylosidase